MRSPAPLTKLTLAEHLNVLEWLDSGSMLRLHLDETQNVHIWALVALASLANRQRTQAERIEILRGQGPISRFAHALGYDPAQGVVTPIAAHQEGRTVRLRRVLRFEEVEKVSSEIAELVLHDNEAEETQRTLYYILVEFLRNAVQHSHDPLGAIVGAQLMDRSREYERRPMVQIAVGDAGIGIMESLKSMHPEITDPHQALVMAQQPWISSQFARGLRGGRQNAGLGLFFAAELAKRTAGRFLLASRGGSIFLQGDQTFQQFHHIVDERPGFPGTVVVFELPIGEIEDYDGLMEVVQASAMERIPAATLIKWLRFEPGPKRGILRIGVRVGAEDTARASQLVRDHLLPRIARREPIEFDFSGLRVCTQSYLHALLFSVLRAAHSSNVPLYVTNASPAVVSSLQFLESYALATELSE